MKLARTTAIVFAVRIFSQVLQAIGLIYFAQALGAHLLGVFVLFQAIVLMFGFIADMGIDGALEKRISEGYGGHIVGSAILLKGVIFALLGVGIVLAQEPINAYIGETLALLLIPVLAVRQTQKVVTKVLKGELRVSEAALLELFQRTTFVVFGILLVFLGHGVLGLVASMILSSGLLTIVGLLRIDTPISRPTMSAIRSLVAFSKYNVIASVVGGYLYSWLDTLLIGWFLPQSHVAAYEIAWRITGIVMMLSRSIGQTIFPQISEWDVKKEHERIKDIIPDAITGALLLVGPAIVGVTLFASEILGFLFGPEFAMANIVLFILMIAKIPEGINTVTGRVLLGMDRPELVAKAVSIFIVLNFGLNLLLIPLYGIKGAALATSISFTINAALTIYYLYPLLEIRVNFHDLFIISLASLGMGLGLYGLTLLVAVTTVPILLTMIALGGVMYFALLALSKNFRQKLYVTYESITG